MTMVVFPSESVKTTSVSPSSTFENNESPSCPSAVTPIGVQVVPSSDISHSFVSELMRSCGVMPSEPSAFIFRPSISMIRPSSAQ